MAGRGRAGMSFSVDQLGLMPGEMLPGPVLQPPPLFPPLEFAPAQASAKPAHMAFRTALINHLRATGMFVALDNQPQGLAINVAAASTQPAAEAPLNVDWSLFPSELSSVTTSLKRPAPSSTRRPAKHLTRLLDELEKKEVKEEDDDEGGKGGAESSAKRKVGEGEEGGGNEGERGEDGEEDGGEWEDADEEMDDGTDYNQNYFDNGEGYLDDSDDNIDDGPVY